MTNQETAAMLLASIMLARAPMGEVSILMPVGEHTVRVGLTIEVKGEAYRAEYSFGKHFVPSNTDVSNIADNMIFEARRLANA